MKSKLIFFFLIFVLYFAPWAVPLARGRGRGLTLLSLFTLF